MDIGMTHFIFFFISNEQLNFYSKQNGYSIHARIHSICKHKGMEWLFHSSVFHSNFHLYISLEGIGWKKISRFFFEKKFSGKKSYLRNIPQEKKILENKFSGKFSPFPFFLFPRQIKFYGKRFLKKKNFGKKF